MRSARFLVVAIVLFSGFLMAPMCGSDEGSHEGSCPEAGEYYARAQAVHRDLVEKLHLGTSWTVVVKNEYVEESQEQTNQIGAGSNGEEFFETVYTGEVKAGAEMVYSFDMPQPPAMLSCDDIVMYKEGSEAGGGDFEEIIWGMLLWEIIDSLDTLEVPADGTSWMSQDRSHTTHDYVYGSMCFHDNPCPRQQDEGNGCPRTTAVVTAAGLIDVYPGDYGESATLGIENDQESFSQEPPVQTYKYIDDQDDIEWDIHIGDNPDACTWATPYCKGESSREEHCGLYDWMVPSFDIHDEVVFEAGTVTLADEENTLTITMTCVSGCECDSDAECDDANACTRDTCQGGNCVNTPDDSIERPQHSLHDCTEQKCKNGKPVDENADYEVPEEDWEGDCKIEECQDGEIVPKNNDDDVEDEDLHDCQRSECQDGNLVEVYDKTQWPTDEDPYDCQTWVCDDATKSKDLVDDNDQAPPDDEPGNCHHTICDYGEPVGLYTNTDPPENTDNDCVYYFCDDLLQDVGMEFRDGENPPQNSPTDCKKEVCSEGESISIDDLTEPGCS